MKKTIAVCMAVLTIVLACCASVSAARTLQLIVESKDAVPGDTVSVSVAVKNNPGFTYMKLGVDYDASTLELVSVQNGVLVESLTEGRYYVWSAADNQAQDGVLVTFTFIVTEKAAAGRHVVSVRSYECSDEQERDVSVAVQQGGVTVKSTPSVQIGDIDGNGKISASDYMLAKKYVLQDIVLTETQQKAADIDGNGKVNAKDYALLKMHVLGRYKIGQ